MGSKTFELPETVPEEELLALVKELNEKPEVNGILVQLPLPAHIDSEKVLLSINPLKDVDGLHEYNIGDLAKNGRNARLIPCTPLGCMDLLERSGVTIRGKHAVVVGRSNLVGKPVSQLLLSADATVTVTHSKTADLPSVIKQADILIAAIGRAQFIKGEWVKPGAVVIDVGINSVDDATAKNGYRLVGDVDFASASKVASLITPVPGGVGPMTVAMLLKNTLRAYRLQHKQQQQPAAPAAAQ